MPPSTTQAFGRAMTRDLARARQRDRAGRARAGGGSHIRGNRAAGERRHAWEFRRARRGRWRFGEHARLGERALCRCRYRPDDDYECVCAVEAARDRCSRAFAFDPRKRRASKSICRPILRSRLVSDDSGGDSTQRARGGAFFVDVHAALSLRNSSQRRIRAITLSVVSQEVTPGGKGSVSVPSLDVAPGETFPLGVDLRLLRPIGSAERHRGGSEARRRPVRRSEFLRPRQAAFAAHA